MSEHVDGGQRIERGARRKENLDNLSAEEASKIAREAIERADAAEARATDAEARATKASSTAQTAANTAAETVIASITARGKQIEDGLASAKSAEVSAKAAWRAAREAGDLDAEAEANDAWTDAKVNVKTFEFQKNDFEANKDNLIQRAKNDAARAAAPANTGPSAEIKQWFKDHPKFETDPAYKRAALDAHELATAVHKIDPNSPAYLAFLNDKLTDRFGADHGKESEHKNDTPARRGSTAAPPGRDSDSGIRSSSTGLRIVVDGAGKEKISGDIPSDWVQAAGWSGMDPVDYAVSQIKIEDQRRRDGVNEPGVYR